MFNVIFFVVLECCPLGTLPFYLHYVGHQTKYFLISRHPQDQGIRSSRLLSPYDSLSWTFICLSITFLSISIIVTVKIYQKIKFAFLEPGLDSGFLFLRAAFGITEPDKIGIVRSFACNTGNTLNGSNSSNSVKYIYKILRRIQSVR